MRRLVLGRTLALLCLTCLCLGAAPAAPTYHDVAATIEKVRQKWTAPNAKPDPNAPGWNALFDTLLGHLDAYSKAATEHDRLTALNQAYQVARALDPIGWAPAVELREELNEWLRPRIRIEWAGRRLIDKVQGLAPTNSEAVKANRDQWLRFFNTDVSRTLHSYDSASTVAQKLDALRLLREAHSALNAQNRTAPWTPSLELQAALDDMFGKPNFDVSIDLPTLAPDLNTNLITSGPVRRKQYVSQVTAGPKTGFGLVPTNDGIAFYNSQRLSTVTPIWDFHQQMMQDPRGQRVAKLYYFQATTFDNAELTITATIRPSGLSLMPSYTHDVNAQISSCPMPGKGLGQMIGSLVGFNEARIEQEVYKNALPKMRESVPREAMEEGLERTGREAANRNALLAQYLIGNNRAAFGQFLVENLFMRTRTDRVEFGGKLEYANLADPLGADAPQPSALAKPGTGVSADVHIVSVLANLARGYLNTDAVKAVDNVMIVTRKRPEGAPMSEGFQRTLNVDYPTFIKAVDAAKEANDPKVQAIRLHRPTKAPEFAADASGNLVALVNDFQIEVPLTGQAARGNALGMPKGKVLRIVSPKAEFAFSVTVTPRTDKDPMRLTGAVKGFDPGPEVKVYAINDDESKATPLTAFSGALVVGFVRQRLLSQTIDLPLTDLPLRGFAVQSVSPLDPSGWMRVNLTRLPAAPAVADASAGTVAK